MPGDSAIDRVRAGRQFDRPGVDVTVTLNPQLELVLVALDQECVCVKSPSSV